jgi:hypothetical protein
MALAVTVAPGGGAVRAAGQPASGIIYVNRVTTPAGTYAVRPDGTGLAAVGCPGDRSYGSSPRRVLRVEPDPSGATFDAYTEALRTQQFPASRIVSRDEACADPTVLIALPSGYRAGDAAWSIDGRRIAIVILRYDAGGTLLDQGIWVAEVGGVCGAPVCGFHLAATFPMQLIVGQPGGGTAFYEHLPFLSWSSDGLRVAEGRRYAPAISAAFGIFVADLGLPGALASAADLRVSIAGGAAEQWDPAFSPVPGDDRISFAQLTSTKGCARYDVFLIAAGGGSTTQLTSTRNANVCQLGRPVWSPDGRWLAFDAWSGGMGSGQAIYRIASDGSTKAVSILATQGVSYYAPRWRS